MCRVILSLRTFSYHVEFFLSGSVPSLVLFLFVNLVFFFYLLLLFANLKERSEMMRKIIKKKERETQRILEG